jgi:hypothetical protein
MTDNVPGELWVVIFASWLSDEAASKTYPVVRAGAAAEGSVGRDRGGAARAAPWAALVPREVGPTDEREAEILFRRAT